MESEKRITIGSDSDIVMARDYGRTIGRSIGFTPTDLTIIATAISEVARNILVFAKTGELILKIAEQPGKKGIIIIAKDEGPGISDISLAMQDGYSTGRGLGLGLPGVRRLVDEFQIISAPRQGTTVTLKKWLVTND